MAENIVDVVVFGATSLTGRFVIKYLANHPDRPSFAIAGRSKSKLEKTHSQANLPSSVKIIVADSFDKNAVREMVSRARCVLNLAGPFHVFNARGIVEECISQKRHYTDLTGESGYAKLVIDDFHEAARRSKSVVVLSSGFDSMPFDVSTYLAIQTLKSQHPDARITNVYSSAAISGAISKGTLMSAVEMASEQGIKWQMKSVRPDAFSPIDGRHQMPWGPLPLPAPAWGGYMFYSPFSPHNHRIVNRTWGLLETEATDSLEKYGMGFQWQDGMVAGRSASWFGALVGGVIIKLFGILLMYFSPVRSLIRGLPDHWSSSTEKTERSAFCDLRTEVHSEQGYKSLCKWYIKGDPGYQKTAVMITETALTIVKHFDQMHPIARKGGVITTAFLAPSLVERLRKAGGFTIETKTLDDGPAKKAQ